MLDDSTKNYYEQNAEAYAAKTLAIPLNDLWDRFSTLLPPEAYVLDLGCGAGRDLKELARRGFRVVGLDYSAALGDIARQFSGQKVRVTDIRTHDFGKEQFDAIWAVASLLHIPRGEVGRVLANLSQHLRSGGILLTSMQEGYEQERGMDGRYFELYQEAEWEGLLNDAGFRVQERRYAKERRQTNSGEVREIKWFVTICCK